MSDSIFGCQHGLAGACTATDRYPSVLRDCLKYVELFWRQCFDDALIVLKDMPKRHAQREGLSQQTFKDDHTVPSELVLIATGEPRLDPLAEAAESGPTAYELPWHVGAEISGRILGVRKYDAVPRANITVLRPVAPLPQLCEQLVFGALRLFEGILDVVPHAFGVSALPDIEYRVVADSAALHLE